ncbi:serine hydrolase domain-containing protein [Deinococcus peraridilitoris]|uniref:Penicillin-binding protein, beta-lactamase class C n=1 Tax=Deinococcus peraridilitoris (strain DSM 19664 / LMG 22246 / CIP 109416 / KR-200) TaxID=937777 RepID=L0A6A3_DEIPD|nr:serine hydrolase domain-containing protein [Deinococcus peraridilitoris]AFZ69376.1 penicillin-binding protein, beta-lactamase class C [Deinococcus peraridilitoris DSM 19664]
MTHPVPVTPLTLDRTQLEALAERTTSLMAQYAVPGVTLGLLTPGGQHELSFGVTSIEHPLPVTPDTLFQIGSVTKTFVALAIMRLVERGDLQLDDRVREYLPDFRLSDQDVAARVTVRQLLNHTAGWAGDHFENTGEGDDALARMMLSVAQLPQVTPLGEVWSYNNAAFYVAGRVIEVVTRQTFEAALRDLVLTPLGLDTSFFFPDEVMTRRFAVGHVIQGGEPVVARPWGLGRSANAAGGLACSVRDLLRYAQFHLRDGTAISGARLLSPDSMQVMHTPTVAAAGDRAMAVSWFVHDESGVRTLMHGGATNGQMATFQLVPERGFAFVALTNGDQGEAVYAELTRWIRQHLLGLVPVQEEYLQVSADVLHELVGRYVMAGAGDVIEVTTDAEGLLLRMIEGDYSSIASVPSDPQPPYRARFYAPDKLVLVDGPYRGTRADVLRFPDGRLRWLRKSRVYVPQH